jgi:hypothetical protein
MRPCTANVKVPCGSVCVYTGAFAHSIFSLEMPALVLTAAQIGRALRPVDGARECSRGRRRGLTLTAGLCGPP